jgi:hypothetical protein
MTTEQRERHSVRPGLTGLAQVNGRNAIAWETKLQFDLDYLKRITFLRDLALIFRTLYKTIKRDGISQEGMDTGMDLGEYLLETKKISLEDFYRREKYLQAIEKT